MYRAACVEWLFAAEDPRFPDRIPGVIAPEYKLTGSTLATARVGLGL